jgi:hypothetical protein
MLKIRGAEVEGIGHSSADSQAAWTCSQLSQTKQKEKCWRGTKRLRKFWKFLISLKK